MNAEVMGALEVMIILLFLLQVPVSVLPWKRVKHRKFGINHQGVMSVNPKTGKVRISYNIAKLPMCSCDAGSLVPRHSFSPSSTPGNEAMLLGEMRRNN